MLAVANEPTCREVAMVSVVILVVSGLASVALGQELSWDLRNYHFYNGYAFLAGRLDQDIAPAGLQTYFNPLLDGLHYVGMRHLPPWVFGALLGALQGVNIILVWAIARATLGPVGRWLAPLAALLGATGQNYVSLLGSTRGETTASIPALAGLLALVSSERPGLLRLFLAGLAGGAAVGLKLTLVTPHVGLALLAGVIAWKQRRPILLIGFALGSLTGWGLTGGWWALELWQRFGNPVFPLANGVFQSPFGPPHSFRLDKYSPQTLRDWLAPPLDAALGFNERLQGPPLRDPRLLVAFVALGVWLPIALRRLRARENVAMPGRGVGFYWLAGYGVWLSVFHYYRYATVLELLAPALALLLLTGIAPRRVTAVALALAAAILISTRVEIWARRPWAAFWFDPRIPPLAQQSNQLVLVRDPTTSYAVPFFPTDSAFIGVFWDYGPEMRLKIQTRIQGHEGPLLMLALPPKIQKKRIRALGFAVDGPCKWARFGRGNRLLLCPLGRLQDGALGKRAGE